MLEPRDPVLYFVQRLRDEAHRFAIGTHRAKRRRRRIGANPLDEIAGIGPRRRRALLKHFGSAKAVSRAGVEDLKAVDGISAEMAQRIYDHFHERRRLSASMRTTRTRGPGRCPGPDARRVSLAASPPA